MSSVPPSSGDTAAAKVVAVVLVRDPSKLEEGLHALDGQVYETAARFVVGGGEESETLAKTHGVQWAKSMTEVIERVPDDVTYLWFTNEEVRPRPDALKALVLESERVQASVAGSKVLRLEEPDVLVSVGLATDVFAVPYLGLESSERDQAQYDVIRNVAAISALSLLVRRDLLRGLQGPDPELAPESAGIDFCHRARLRGARVVVIPSSEVLVPLSERPRTTPWLEEAGRIRAMLKSYSLITLLWTLPFAFLIGLVEAVVAPLLGRWTLFGFIRAWVWNFFKLPSTIRARFATRRKRVYGDEELFRYQLRGSARLRSLVAEVGDRIQERQPQTRVKGLAGAWEATQDTLRSPGFIAGAVGLGVVVLATRTIWTGRLPAVGYSLPPSPSALNTLDAYAGGWNPAGLGSPYPLEPSVGFIAGLQGLLLDRAELTATIVTIGALWAGVVGMARLLRGWGIRPPAAYVGGVVLVVGPAAQALGDATQWTALLALGALPWAIRIALRPWPRSWLGRAGRIAAVGWTTGLAAAAQPSLLVVPTAVLALWALLAVGARWWAVVRAAAGALVAIPLLFPWFGIIGLTVYLQQGEPAFWRPGWPIAIVVLTAGVSIVVAGDRVLAAVAGWGTALAAGGLLIARTGNLDFGTAAANTGMILAALGAAAVAGAAVEIWGRLEFTRLWRRALAVTGVAAALVLLAWSVPAIAPGRAGLPGDELRGLLEFTAVQGEQAESVRVLMMGPQDTLPGESRLLDATPYRVVAPPVPRLWEARLDEPRLGDQELKGVLRSMAAGEVARAGEALAPFGIQWVVLTGETAFDSALAGQLDLVPLPGLEGTVFFNEASARRAVASDGSEWTWDAPHYRGPADPVATVYVAENGDQRWAPHPWSQSGWANELAATEGEVRFEPRPGMRREAITAALLFVVLVAIATAGTGRRAR